jgi:hypothetical protein
MVTGDRPNRGNAMKAPRPQVADAKPAALQLPIKRE